ncbi:hypothetical protein CLV30_111114 [Haloactinopolyspora alba]|uniref:Uncharacterized protein n=1 Tax=Haloactinopolyspora alba TaxID=648780 RepID=A0A2P8DY59_9ACTN|nr:hypothetical protein [Haloactinopolyspora alba]PSL02159.1 hypothetical protein CLV30_111114 [Haloactinopolyspora alba]
MRRIRLAPVVAALAVAGACGPDASGDDQPAGPDEPDAPDASETTVELDVTLDAELGTGSPSGTAYPPEAQGLVAEYTVTNNTEGPVLVAERRPDVATVDVGIPLPDTAESTWVYAGDDGTVRVTKEMFPVAGDGTNGQAYTVPARRLASGESMTARAFALTPLRRIVAHPDAFDVPGPSELPADATQWRFCVQVAPDPGTRDEPAIFDYTPDRQLLCSDAASLPSGALADR